MISLPPKTWQVDDLTIEIQATRSIEHFKQDWLNLEQTIKPPFFLSWQWISCWVETYHPELISVVASQDQRVVAMGLFTQSCDIRHTVIRSRQWRLHQTGDPAQDQIWIEFNDFLCHPKEKERVVTACLKSLSNKEYEGDEIVISMMPASRANYLAKQLPHACTEMDAPCYSVDLEALRYENTPYLDTLSGNTRHQIKRSMRLYEKDYGPLQVQYAESCQQALELFHEAAHYHTARWADSGYHNPQFLKFHENIIKAAFDEGHIGLMKVDAGDTNLAILYYHISYNNVYFYLQGLNYPTDKKLKPGLVAHVLATDYFIQAGMNQYHYMGGYSQYKKQLAHSSEGLATLVIQRPLSRFKLENMARVIKKRIMSSTK